MKQLLIAIVLVAVAGGIAALVRRRTVVDAPSTPRSHAVPAQLDREDFARPEAPWLVVLFSSATCETCALVRDKVGVLASSDVAVHDAEFTAARRLHERYGIDAVPTVVVADAAGVVRASFIGPMSATDLWAAVAEARDPGSSPEPWLGRDLS
ncbi:MAG: hypothetical protein AB7Q42_00060 [Acidimicrobiia bacterium]